MIVEVGALLLESSFQFGDSRVECHFVRALFGWCPGNDYLGFACFLLSAAIGWKAIFSLERPSTKRHTQHKPIIEEPLHDTTTSATDDVKVVMDEIKKKLVTWGQFEKVLRDSKLRHGEAA